jgi:hypothetical protein
MDDTQPPPLLVNGEEEYEVERILAIRRRKIGQGYHDEALVKWVGWARETWMKLDFVQDCIVLDVFKKQHGPVQEVIQRQLDNNNHVVVPLMRFRLGGGYYHGPVPDTRHGLAPAHVTVAC